MDAGARAISAAERGDGMSLLIEGIGAPITCADCDYSIYVGLGNMYCKLACKKEKTDIASKRRADVDDCLDAIKYAETVIEAERSEE